MGWVVRITNGVRWQGKNVIWDVFTVRASVGGHKVPHRRGMGIMGKSGCGRGCLVLP